MSEIAILNQVGRLLWQSRMPPGQSKNGKRIGYGKLVLLRHAVVALGQYERGCDPRGTIIEPQLLF